MAVPDSDGDTVSDDDDLCPGTTADSPTLGLRNGSYGDTDLDGVFDTVVSPFNPSQTLPRVFTLADTSGCSCTQIGADLGLSLLTDTYGCSAAHARSVDPAGQPRPGADPAADQPAVAPPVFGALEAPPKRSL